MIKIFSAICAVFIACGSFAQNLDKIGKKEMVTASGGLNYSANYFDSYGKPTGRDPFTWVLGGNFNLSVLDVSLPFTFTFTDQGASYTQPFNMVAIHPSYKNFKSHIGIISLSYSPYTLSGLNLAGAGVEFSPGKWKFQAFGGRLKKQIAYVPEINNLQTLSYSRYGGGFSVGYENKGYGLQFILLKASDNANSITVIPDAATITPMDNIVASVKGKGKIGQAVTFEAEYASSILTRNTAFEGEADRTKFAGKLSPLVNGNLTTVAYGAFNGGINYRYKFFGIGGKYERIDPGYTTLGGLYFVNDIENITVTPNLNLFKGKLSININAGLQRNNLDNLNSTDTKRWVGTVSASSSPFKNFTVSGAYSNFSSFSRRNPAADPFYNQLFDTLNYYQISTSANGSMIYSIGKDIKNSFTLNSTYSVSNNITGRLQDAAAFGFNVDGNNYTGPVTSVSGMFGHTLNFSKSKFSLGYTFNANQTSVMNSESLFLGPGVNFSKNFEKPKVTINSGIIYNRNYANSVLSSDILNTRLGFSYAPQWWDKKYGTMSIGLNGSLVSRFPVGAASLQRDFTLLLNLNYSL